MLKEKPLKTTRKQTIVLIGLGDLAKKIGAALMSSPMRSFDHLVIISRNKSNGESYTRLLAGCGDKKVSFCPLDALDTTALTEQLQAINPQLVIQCASLMSPWLLFESHHQQAKSLLQAGFAAQLPAQLPVAISLMRALKNAALNIPVINCSYPDVVNPILAKLGLPATLGIGNSGMIHGLIRHHLQQTGVATDTLKVFAHHAHIGSVANSQLQATMPAPIAYLQQQPVDVHAALFGQPPIILNRELNVLTAAHTVSVIESMLLTDQPLCTSVPGPLGLPGGWPVHICGSSIRLDLPPEVNIDQMTKMQNLWAMFDGVKNISKNGTIDFSESCVAQLKQFAPELAEPLNPLFALQRFKKIGELLNNEHQR